MKTMTASTNKSGQLGNSGLERACVMDLYCLR